MASLSQTENIHGYQSHTSFTHLEVVLNFHRQVNTNYTHTHSLSILKAIFQVDLG